VIDVIVNFEGLTTGISTVVQNAVAAALKHEHAIGDVNVVLTDDFEIQTLNKNFRNIDTTTDVLSFPANEGAEIETIPDESLGDIAISCVRAYLQAEEYGHSPEREFAFLAVHGTLHILGYDHVNEEDANKMYALQEIILNDMGLKR
jgi:probable rRNA maturation factor